LRPPRKRPQGRVGGQSGGALEECRRRDDAAPALGSAGGCFEFGGDRIVGLWRGAGGVPGPAVGVRLRFGCIGQRSVDFSAVGQIGRTVGG
jgi:hypothetical protein